MKNQIQNINVEDVKGYEKLVNFTKKIFDKGFTELADVPFDKPLNIEKKTPYSNCDAGCVFPWGHDRVGWVWVS